MSISLYTEIVTCLMSVLLALIHSVIRSLFCVKRLLRNSCFLLQGRYQVKFLVDKIWRTAPDWPMVQSQHGTNNVLQVE